MSQATSQLNVRTGRIQDNLKRGKIINQMPRRLRRKTSQQEEMGVDRISDLPDSLITSILSLLPMKDAVKTCVLATDWRYYWTQVDNIVFEFKTCKRHDREEQEKVRRFMLFVDKTLMRSTCPKIKTFSLTGDFNYMVGNLRKVGLRMEKLVNKWLDFVLEKDVKFINLGFRGLPVRIPSSLYHSSSLERLEIVEMGEQHSYTDLYTSIAKTVIRGRLVCCRKPFDVCWSMLKSLFLRSVYVVEEVMAKILLGCPMLETLGLKDVKGVSKLDISSPNLRELKLIEMSATFEERTIELDITAPWIKTLEVGKCFSSFNCNLVNVTSLEKAKLTLRYKNFVHVDMHDEDYMSVILIDKLLKPVCRVDDLFIGAELLQALSLSQLTNEPSMEFQCKDLVIDSSLCEHDVPGIACLLESSPNLESLVVMLNPPCHTYSYDSTDCYKYNKYINEVFTSFDGVDYLSELNRTFPRLKNVKIDCRKKSYPRHGSDVMCYEFEIAAYIIEHSTSLEKLVILCSNSNHSRCGHRYFSLLSSEHMVGKIARQWQLKKTGSTYEFSFCR